MLEIAFRKIESVAVLDLTGNINIDSANFIEKNRLVFGKRLPGHPL